MIHMLETRKLTKTYRLRRGAEVQALSALDLMLDAGETLGVVGESGSGKTTLSRLLLGIEAPTSGQVLFRGTERTQFEKADHDSYINAVSAVFQNPYSSLNPRRRLWDIITERQAIQGGVPRQARRARAVDLLQLVGLRAEFADRFPHELSGGQRQRVAIARALSQDPSVIVMDEPMSALDVSVSAQISNLLLELQAQLGVSYLFITHDMHQVRHLCHRVMVLLKGECVERGTTETVLGSPRHPYTRGLIDASELRSLDASELRSLDVVSSTTQ